jgi:hypothetical protein
LRRDPTQKEIDDEIERRRREDPKFPAWYPPSPAAGIPAPAGKVLSPSPVKTIRAVPISSNPRTLALILRALQMSGSTIPDELAGDILATGFKKGTPLHAFIKAYQTQAPALFKAGSSSVNTLLAELPKDGDSTTSRLLETFHNFFESMYNNKIRLVAAALPRPCIINSDATQQACIRQYPEIKAKTVKFMQDFIKQLMNGYVRTFGIEGREDTDYVGKFNAVWPIFEQLFGKSLVNTTLKLGQTSIATHIQNPTQK